ncbi:MAG: hypothetical protein IKW90_15685 [Lachnospiraceae bacterium]|nr:hypothetical protein [Lachnospiraceae bacterium]
MKKERLNPALIRAVYSSYRNQRRIMNDLNRRLSAATTREEWTSIYQERAATIRAAFDVNTETTVLINDTVFANKLDYDYAESFYHEDFSVQTEENSDIFFSCRLLTTLADYYREQHDLIRLLPLLDRLGQNYIATVKMHMASNYNKALECYREILSYRSNYSLIPDLSIRKLFFQAYYSLSCILPIVECKDTIAPSQSLDYLLEVFSFYNSPTVQKIDGQSEEIARCIDNIKENWLWIEYRIDVADPETIAAFIKVSHDVYDKMLRAANNDILKLPVSTVIAFQHAAILEGNTSYIDAVNYMMNYYNNKRAANAEALGNEFNEGDFYFQTKLPIALIKWLDKIDILSDMCAAMRKKLIDEQNSYFISLSERKIFSHKIYEACCSWCFFAVNYLGTREEKENFLISMLINRQPLTFFNAYLNAELAVLVAESLYLHTPILLNACETFLKVNGMSFTRRDVIEFIRKCALFHDIGLNRISKIDGTQYRKLTDLEFDVIRRHPELGAEIATGNLSIYRDVILGHHKTYDQTDGYPKDMDFSNSPLKVVCDILTICDALNSGTDKSGRCYKEPKDFSIVLSELITDSGTKYNTSIVNLFLNDMDLAYKVDKLISRDRENIYYDYFVKYFDKPTV